jgi:hypothetical protein
MELQHLGAIPYDRPTTDDCWGAYIPSLSLWLGQKFYDKVDAVSYAVYFAPMVAVSGNENEPVKAGIEVRLVPASLTKTYKEEWENEFIGLVEEIGECIDDKKSNKQLEKELIALMNFISRTIDIITQTQ